MTKRRIYLSKLGFVFVVAISLLAGWYLGFKGYRLVVSPEEVQIINREPPSTVEVADFSLFWRTLDLLESKYYESGQLDGQKVLYGAIKGAVDSVDDPYTAFFTPEENKEFKNSLSGSYEGIGAQLGYIDHQLVIVAPLKDSPAEAAGIREGDAILEVEGESTTDWTLAKAVSKIRGEGGTIVSLTLGRRMEGKDQLEVVEIEVPREEIQIPTVSLSWRDDIAIVRIFRFGENIRSEWESVVEEVKEKDASGIVLDVRNNPGGYLEGALIVGSEFFSTGQIVLRQSAEGQIRGLGLDHSGKLTRTPLVVLVNGGSASASEIIAGAIQVRDRGKLVGGKTFGKGTVQEAIELEEGAGLHVTVADWLLPDGTSIHNQGLDPDFKVKPSEEEVGKKVDVQLEKALEILSK